ncbi:MAG: tetratricopeptide repeat protein [Polyangiaceae bacterium]|nr:tetratricopeptide repeat protein [Polyangiaceae bacterium]
MKLRTSLGSPIARLAAFALAAGLLASSGRTASADQPTPDATSAPAAPAPSASAPSLSNDVNDQDDVLLRGDAKKAVEAVTLINELSTDEASKKLEGADTNDALLTYARAMLAHYEGRCVDASALYREPLLLQHGPSQRLLEITQGCESTMAGAVVREDAASGTWIRFQHEADAVLAPFIYEVVSAQRAVFQRDLGVTMPPVIRIELVRDQMGLSAMTGLPLKAARTTGTVGIAKFGRVIVVSPRATDNGYPVLDTLAHELTHLALTRASGDEAPLWFQEGVARTMEVRWRASTPFDHVPDPDDLAAFGIKKNIGPEIDKIGPSIALLPSAEEAQVTYAKVQSFTEFFAREAGTDAMPKLLAAMRDSAGAETPIGTIVETATGAPFDTWATRWKADVLSTTKELPERDRPAAPPAKELKEVRQRFRLGQLLHDRGHAPSAAKELERGLTLMPSEAPVRALFSRALFDSNEPARAKQLVERPEDVHDNEARWWSMRAALGVPDTNVAIRMAIALAPYDPAVACEEKSAPHLPEDAARRALCEAARIKPRGR